MKDNESCEIAMKAALEVIEESCGEMGDMVREQTPQKTSIRIKMRVYNRLDKLGTVLDTFNIVLKRLLDCYENIPEVKKHIKEVSQYIKSDLTLREDEEESKAVRVDIEVAERIALLGTVSDTYSSVIEKMLDVSCEKKLQQIRDRVEAALRGK